MESRPESDEGLVQRLLPSANPDARDRALAWNEWQAGPGISSLRKYIRYANHTDEPDEDILQDALLTAYLEVERGRYESRAGIPFTAYIKGIARNKIREAHRRGRNLLPIDDLSELPAERSIRHLEAKLERIERRDALYRGLSRLPAQRRQVLERMIRGESTAEIASHLAISEELVRQHKHRGLNRLQQLGFWE
jgi:RNA polymerase sigma factor (sigma-70 family)